MTENSELGNLELEEKGTGKFSVSDQTNSLQYTNMKSDSFTVDMERFSHLTNKDINLNSRINRSLSRKGSQRWGEKKVNLPSTDNDRDGNHTSSPRAALVGGSTPEKPMVVTVGTGDQAMNPQVHHQITITTGHVAATSTTTSTATISAAESRLGGKRFSFRRSNSSSTSWTIDPRRILFFFATFESARPIDGKSIHVRFHRLLGTMVALHGSVHHWKGQAWELYF